MKAVVSLAVSVLLVALLDGCTAAPIPAIDSEGPKPQDEDHKIAFSVSLTSIFGPVSGGDQPIPFDKIIRNDGGGYQASQFKAPAEGVYFFTATIRPVNGEESSAHIFHNGDEVYAQVHVSANELNSGTNSVILQLELGDLVWVGLSSENGGRVLGNSGGSTTFSGFLLFE